MVTAESRKLLGEDLIKPLIDMAADSLSMETQMHVVSSTWHHMIPPPLPRAISQCQASGRPGESNALGH